MEKCSSAAEKTAGILLVNAEPYDSATGLFDPPAICSQRPGDTATLLKNGKFDCCTTQAALRSLSFPLS